MSLRQILLVLKREYSTRIRSKAFIIATILIPVGMVALLGIGLGIALWDTNVQHTIGIIDQTNAIYPQLQKLNADRYKDFSTFPKDSLRMLVLTKNIDGYIIFDDANITDNKNPAFFTSGTGGIQLRSSIQSDVREVIRQAKLKRANVSKNVQQIYNSQINLDTHKITAGGKDTRDDTGFLSIIGLIMGIVIFISVLGYGGLITRSVIEEKTNRIIEVIASSVSPIELLLGKMAGVGALALTQLGIWLISFTGLALGAEALLSPDIPDSTISSEAASASSQFMLPQLDPSLIMYFLIFFVLGYLIYSSLFAAIGSAVDSEADTQQYMFPIMIPVMIGYFIMFRAMQSPDSSLAIAGSLIPFCAPIVMITRIAITDVPLWEILLSILLMAGTFAGTMWLSAKIYSVGILNYGQNAGFKELIKWIRE